MQDSHVNCFKNWCLKHNINPGDITYSQALQFIDSERERGIEKQSIIREINSIRIYFDYFLESGITGQNIIKRIRIRQSGKTVLPEILSPAQLDKIYQDFTSLPAWNYGTAAAKLLHQRNTVILGLLIYQGLDSGKIARLETGHVNLSEGKIYTPSDRNSNPRTLRLQANQILPIKTYLEETRPALLEKRDLQRSLLFPSKKSSDMVFKIVAAVKKIHPEIKDSRQHHGIDGLGKKSKPEKIDRRQKDDEGSGDDLKKE